MGRLSDNFKSWEFRCSCCGVVKIDDALILALQEFRTRAHEPIHILSGYRCWYHNASIGGKRNSQHLLGKAADITLYGWTTNEMFLMARSIPEFWDGGIGIYPTKHFVHVDVRGEQARWGEA